MPSSILLAIVVGAGVLALIPTLVRRYDTAIQAQYELRSSPMRVLVRRRRQRTVPGAAPVRPPTTVLPISTGRTSADAGGAAARTAAVRDRVLAGAVAAAAVGSGTGPAMPAGGARVRRTAITGFADGGRPWSVPHGPVTRTVGGRTPVGAPVSAVPLTRPVPVPVPSVPVRLRSAGPRPWQRRRRRQVLTSFGGILTLQALGAAVVDPVLVVAVLVTGLLATGYVLRLRTLAAAERRHLLAARSRRHRADAFIRRTVRTARPEVAAWLGASALDQTVGWLALPRQERRRPARDVVRVLAAAGREAYRAADGTWAVRRASTPGRRTRPAAPMPAAAMSPAAGQTGLPRVVNA